MSFITNVHVNSMQSLLEGAIAKKIVVDLGVVKLVGKKKAYESLRL